MIPCEIQNIFLGVRIKIFKRIGRKELKHEKRLTARGFCDSGILCNSIVITLVAEFMHIVIHNSDRK